MYFEYEKSEIFLKKKFSRRLVEVLKRINMIFNALIFTNGIINERVYAII